MNFWKISGILNSEKKLKESMIQKIQSMKKKLKKISLIYCMNISEMPKLKIFLGMQEKVSLDTCKPILLSDTTMKSITRPLKRLILLLMIRY